ncbi:MAG: ABC transporter ATP-binding protein [Planctomycetes bacterium]|nr:ABC transporter ATP-binding protein [Planctomycetota bacterium]
MLELKQISKIFSGPQGPVRVLSESCLSVKPGEFVAVHGPSGCGKSTMLLIAGGLLAPGKGKVLIDGQDPYKMAPNQRCGFRAGKLGFVFQQFHLVPYLTVLENVLTIATVNRIENPSRRAKELISHFSLDHRMNHLPSQLSTGERQRVALARALFNNPKLILADEPTGNLDEKNAAMVFEYLAEFTANGGAVLVVTHDVKAAKYAHRTVHLKDGKVVQES